MRPSTELPTTPGAAEPRVVQARRGWGPFSGGQLTVIIVALATLIGFPVAAFAVTGSNIFVTDPASGARARVTSTGNVQAAVTGSVTATAAPPGSTFVKFAFAVGGGKACGFLTPPSGQALVITAVNQVPVGATVGTDVQLNVLADTAPACAGTRTSIANGLFASDAPHEIVLDPGIGLKNGHYLDLNVNGTSASPSFVYVYGYKVPASACTTGCL